MSTICCKGCLSPDCKGCNLYILSEMLHEGKLDALMNENHTIKSQWLGVYEPSLIENGTYVVDDGVIYKLMPKITYWPGAKMINALTGETHYQTNYAKVVNMSRQELAKWVVDEGRKFGEEYEGYMSLLDWLNEEETV